MSARFLRIMNVILTPSVLTLMDHIFVAAHEVTVEMVECALVRDKVLICLFCSIVDCKNYSMENIPLSLVQRLFFLTKPSWYHIVPDVDECASPETNECHLNAVCTNTEGTYVCRCKKGFSGDGKNCTGKIPKVFRLFFMLNFIIPFFLSFWEVL